ncbi:udp-glucose 6-dehydrogenase [Aspergillus heteromorphus CBS 117.55]|uniref:UDP-glucose 6-dehydrogenase n=1 Tax=Aspergillus heteromorphus CBS 117.55 TaxID=1448321 RepID=A0A317WU11_9EURO|nr:udp-glucose 6-dehydrogenase [Aspergillus heteromorphus CBS 117.55]PWY89903.1 udp-glucose 6-dehydrogenase [Aspergillus heteromorphus CBS 117.55]
MDISSSPLSSTEWSLDGSSTCPTTPASSPLFRAAKVDDSSSLHSTSPATASEGRAFNTSSSTSTKIPLYDGVKSVCVVGAGYVGGPTAAILALYNPSVRVSVLDRDPRRIQSWKSHHLPVHEPALQNVVRVTRDGSDVAPNAINEPLAFSSRHPNLFFTCDPTSIAQADMVFLAVNTPTKTFGLGAGRATDMRAVDGAVQEIALHAKPGAILVEKSTVPCGTAERVRQTLSTLRPGISFEVLSNPEFLSEGSAIENLVSPDRVLIGSSGTPSGRRAARMLAHLYSSWVPPAQILQVNSWSSELAKLVANAMLAQRISSINSISAICEKTGADVDQVGRAVGMDARIGAQFLKAGVGFGGSCFRKDIASLTYLAESLGLEEVADYWRQVNSMNEYQRVRFARKVVDRFDGNLTGRKIAVLGFAFKKDTGDTRESPVVDVIRSLMEERPMEIAIFDLFCHEEDILRELEVSCGAEAIANGVKIISDPYLACSQAHAVLVMTDCEQFKNGCKRSSGMVLGSRADPEAYESLDEMLSPSRKSETWNFHGMTYRLAPQDACSSNCTACRSWSPRPAASEPLEWARIAYNLKDPKWVFDGRGCLDVPELEKLGLQVEAIGRRN